MDVKLAAPPIDGGLIGLPCPPTDHILSEVWSSAEWSAGEGPKMGLTHLTHADWLTCRGTAFGAAGDGRPVSNWDGRPAVDSL